MAISTRHMIVERRAVAGRMAGQGNGVPGYDLPLPSSQPPAHLSALPSREWCLLTAPFGFSTRTCDRYGHQPLVDGDANDPGRLQAGRPAVLLGTKRRKAGLFPTRVGACAGSPEAAKG